MVAKGMRKARRERVLTEVLRLRGEGQASSSPEKRNELLAEMLWEAATTGVIVFPETSRVEERVVKLSARDWRDLTSWIYSQIDGPASNASDSDDEVTLLLRGSSREELLALVASATDSHQSEESGDAGDTVAGDADDAGEDSDG